MDAPYTQQQQGEIEMSWRGDYRVCPVKTTPPLMQARTTPSIDARFDCQLHLCSGNTCIIAELVPSAYTLTGRNKNRVHIAARILCRLQASLCRPSPTVHQTTDAPGARTPGPSPQTCAQQHPQQSQSSHPCSPMDTRSRDKNTLCLNMCVNFHICRWRSTSAIHA